MKALDYSSSLPVTDTRKNTLDLDIRNEIDLCGW